MHRTALEGGSSLLGSTRLIHRQMQENDQENIVEKKRPAAGQQRLRVHFVYPVSEDLHQLQADDNDGHGHKYPWDRTADQIRNIRLHGSPPIV